MADDELLTNISRQLEEVKTGLNACSGYLKVIAQVQVKLLAMAEQRAAKPAAPPPAEESSGGRAKREKGDRFTTTGMVARCSMLRDAEGEPKLTKNKGKMWTFELDNGFKATLFKEKDFKLAENAAASRRPLIVEYEKSGQYDNVESLKLGAAKVPDASKPKEPNPFGDDDEAAGSAGSDW